jgi:endonuclease IV
MKYTNQMKFGAHVSIAEILEKVGNPDLEICLDTAHQLKE